tara:strand:+ start:4327 stop:4617 length:291 start_codon:yes stop_codon:yes gene_type:complete
MTTNWEKIMLSTETKAAVVKDYQRAAADTGSPEVQVALITARIRDLQNHFTKNKKDKHSRLGLTKLVAKRRKLLKYLKATKLAVYRDLIAKLGLRG